MGSDHRRHALTATVAGCFALTVILSVSLPARAALAWWSPVALRGTAITRVSAIGDTIMVRTATGATLLSTDGGTIFATAPDTASFPPLNVVTAGRERWRSIRLGAYCTWLIRL